MADDVSVVIADDENHIRTLISTLVRTLSFTVVGEAANGVEAVQLVEEKHPEIVLLDINMPQMNGVDSLHRILESFPETCVIMLTSIADIETIEECIEAGAANFIRKDTPLDEMKGLILSTWTRFQSEAS